eukprot:TRINITY_DN844_c0_g1_i1.p1 TRINITY_DN844_c0_g1~~TRINITY_DN844_c0_g1_i1.p1  ORF type:complete len:1372 (-),score=393.45 TRINITY_DN844_c0_g1_i1:381-4496(-)
MTPSSGMTILPLLLLLLTFWVSLGRSFNLNVPSRVIHSPGYRSCRNGDCMFGFSVALHSPRRGSGRNASSSSNWLLVGAPKADLNIGGLDKSGGVFKCSPDLSGTCEVIPFDMEGNSYSASGEQYESKSGQWFGATVRSSKSADVVLACAPRYLWFSTNFKRREPVGKCYVARNDFKDFQEYSPCSTRKWGYHRQGSCQAGFGADVSDDGEYIFVGAVGSWYWQGQIFSQKLDSRRQARTKESSPSDDDSYLGYSLTTGEFNGDGDGRDIAVGMPRGANLTGKVILYDVNMTNLNNLTGDQIGAYFGYSVASGDFNGDGRDDLAIGAPMWTNYRSIGEFEVGRAYIVYQNTENRFVKWSSIDGSVHKARFGLSVACAGNLDLDGIGKDGSSRGYEDLLVGAPYDGKDSGGAVYVFRGSEEGIRSKPSQVIYASDIDRSLRTFGWSLSGGLDLDGNSYPEVLVGSPESSKAIYLQSSPVIHLESSLRFLVEGKTINLEEKKCSLKSGATRVPCIDVDLEMAYDGLGIPERLVLDLEYILDAKKDRSKRMFFLDEEGTSVLNQSIQVLKGHAWRKSFTVYLLPSRLHDKLSSLDLKVKYSMNRDSSVNSFGASIPPVISLDDRSVTDSISIKKDCGVDNECIPNLVLSSEFPESYVIGSEEKLTLSSVISNQGEDAFNAYLYASVPKGLNYIKTKTSSGSSVSVLCSPPSQQNNRTLKCEIGNPLPANSEVKLDLLFQPLESEALSDSYDFVLTANSSNPEESFNKEDNEEEIRIKIEVQASLKLSGTSKPEQVSYNLTGNLPDKYTLEDEIGEEVSHIYDVNNRGPSAIAEALLFILWPSFTENGKHSLYLLGVDYDGSKVTCEPIDNINPLYVKTIGSRDYGRMREEMEASGRLNWWARKSPLEASLNSEENIRMRESTGQESSSSGSRSKGLHTTFTESNRIGESHPRFRQKNKSSNGGAFVEETGSKDQMNSEQSSGVSTGGGSTSGHHMSSSGSDSIQSGGNVLLRAGESWQRLSNGSYIKIFHGPQSGGSQNEGVPNTYDSSYFENSGWARSPNQDLSGGSSQQGDSGRFASGGFSSSSSSHSQSSGSQSSGGVSSHSSGSQASSSGSSSGSQAFGNSQVSGESIQGNSIDGGDHTAHVSTGGSSGSQMVYSESGNWKWSDEINKWRWVGSTSSNSLGNLGGSDSWEGDSNSDQRGFHTESRNLFDPDLNIKRVRRAISEDPELESELSECTPERCTLIACRLGPLEKEESVIFKIRSRLFTQSHIEDYQKKVAVSSKIIAKISKLPYSKPLEEPHTEIVSDFVTTEVFPTQLGSETVAWWIWLLAAIFGLLLLLLICYCLYRCGFFRRTRPDTSPEREPLNSSPMH